MPEDRVCPIYQPRRGWFHRWRVRRATRIFHKHLLETPYTDPEEVRGRGWVERPSSFNVDDLHHQREWVGGRYTAQGARTHDDDV